jgi:hypothetical protein
MNRIAVVFLQLAGFVVHHQRAVEVVAEPINPAQVLQPVFLARAGEILLISVRLARRPT